MKPSGISFLGLDPALCDFSKAKVAIVPFGYEGGVSYGRGAAAAPAAVVEASQNLELYDDRLDAEPCQVGITTIAQPEIDDNPKTMLDTLEVMAGELMDQGKFVVVIGGDHSITTGYARALAKRSDNFGVLQLDAHADLRDSYEGNPLSHACTMARVREITPHTLQIGIRSMSLEEARLVERQKLAFCTMERFRRGKFDLARELASLPENLFITVDVDVFDWSVIASTGTPEPGGMVWDEAVDLLEVVFHNKTVIGFDVVELAHRNHDPNSTFATAKLIYKMIGMKYAEMLKKAS